MYQQSIPPQARTGQNDAEYVPRGSLHWQRPHGGIWGILKQEHYYSKRFTSKQELVQMIEHYIRYYNTRRVQRNLGVLTTMEKHALFLAA